MEINGSTTKAKNPEAPDSVEEQTAEIIACLDAGATIIQTGAPKGVVVNAFGTNFLNYPDAIKTYGGAEALENVAKHTPGALPQPSPLRWSRLGNSSVRSVCTQHAWASVDMMI
jgi:hypothetical protein